MGGLSFPGWTSSVSIRAPSRATERWMTFGTTSTGWTGFNPRSVASDGAMSAGWSRACAALFQSALRRERRSDALGRARAAAPDNVSIRAPSRATERCDLLTASRPPMKFQSALRRERRSDPRGAGLQRCSHPVSIRAPSRATERLKSGADRESSTHVSIRAPSRATERCRRLANRCARRSFNPRSVASDGAIGDGWPRAQR